MNDTDVIKVTLSRWKFGQKFTCKKCGKGKFEALDTINSCPKCGQKHTYVVGL